MLIFLEKHSLDLVTARIVENNSTKLQEKVKVYRNFFTSDEAKIAQCEKVLFLQSSLAKLFVRKKIVENNIYFPVDMDLGEDLYFTYLYMDNVEKIGFVSTSSYIVENINGESLSKKYINNLEASLIEQGKLKAHFEAKHLQYAKEYYKTHVDFNFYQTTLFVSNLYKLGVDKNYMQKRKELRKFLDSHKEWWKITNPERYPKNLKDKIMYKIISSNNVTLILAFFMFKERLRRMKFSFGKNEKVKISVIVPIYNVEKYLKKCLDSIINQTFKEFEIILVDDGSTDNSEMICKEYRRKDSRIVYLKKNNGGLSDARNYGLDYANGEYVAFIDSDDYLEKNFLEFLYRAIRTSKSEVAVCGFVIEYEDEKNLQDVSLHEDNVTITGKDLLHRVMKYKDGYSYVVAWNKLYKRELFDNIKFAKGKVYEDEWINYPLFWNVDKVYLLDKKLYHYVQRTGSIKNSRMSLKKIESMNEMLKDRILFYKDKDIKLFILANIRYRNWLINTLCRNKSMLSNEIITEWQEEFRKSVKNTRKIDKKERTIYWKLVDILGYININLTANIRKGLADLQEKI